MLRSTVGEDVVKWPYLTSNNKPCKINFPWLHGNWSFYAYIPTRRSEIIKTQLISYRQFGLHQHRLKISTPAIFYMHRLDEALAWRAYPECSIFKQRRGLTQHSLLIFKLCLPLTGKMSAGAYDHVTYNWRYGSILISRTNWLGSWWRDGRFFNPWSLKK